MNDRPRFLSIVPFRLYTVLALILYLWVVANGNLPIFIIGLALVLLSAMV